MAAPEYCGPGSRLQSGNTDAPLLGNGDLGVNLCGSASKPTFYIGKNDFWSTYNADVTHNMYQSVANVASVQLDLSQLGNPAESAGAYQLEQQLANATVTSAFKYSNGAIFTTKSIVAAHSNVLLTELLSSVATEVTISVITGSATGTKRGLPVSAGSAQIVLDNNPNSSVVYIARNSCSTDHVHPPAVVRDCRDHLLDSFGQQLFVIDPSTHQLAVSSQDVQERRCLLLKEPTVNSVSTANSVSSDLTGGGAAGADIDPNRSLWLTFAGINSLYYPTR
jgi:hypothetical protein